MSHIFISYSRKDFAFAQKIVTALADNNLDTWVDWKSIPKGEGWEQEIYRGIEEADAFLFLISPDSVTSEMCNKEIAHAVKNGKRILPIVLRDTNPKTIHPEISKRNWIFCRKRLDDFNKAIDEAHKTIHTDYEWLKYHTKLQVKALDWERVKDASRLLRGKELRDAEKQLAEVGNQEDPQPTKLQREYILASQRNEIHIRRQITIGLVTGLAVMIILSFVAWGQRNEAVSQKATAQANEAEAQQQARLALAGKLGAESKIILEQDPTQSLLLAIESVTTTLNFDEPVLPVAEQALRDSLGLFTSAPPKEFVLNGDSAMIKLLSFSPDNRWLASCTSDGVIRIQDLSDLTVPVIVINNIGENASAINFSPDSRFLTVGYDNGVVRIWELTDLIEPAFVIDSLTGAVSSIVFDQDSYSWFAIGGENGTATSVWKWDFEDINASPQLQKVLQGGSKVIFHPTGDWFVTTSGSTIRFWNLNSLYDPPIVLQGDSQLITTLAFSKYGEWFAAGGIDTNIRVWNTRDMLNFSNSPILLKSHDDNITDLKFTPNENLLASSSYDTTVRLWNMDDPFAEPLVFRNNQGIVDLDISPDGRSLVAGGLDTVVRLWDLTYPSNQPVEFPGFESWVGALSFSSNSKWLAISNKGEIHLWDMKSVVGNPIVLRDDGGDINDLAFTPNGQWLATASGSDKKGVRLWNMNNFFASPIVLHTSTTESLIAISPNGRWIAGGGFGGYDDDLVLWDISKPVPLPSVLAACRRGTVGEDFRCKTGQKSLKSHRKPCV